MAQIAWPNAAKLALSLVVNVEEGAEARIDDGDKRPEPVDELGIAIRHPIRNYGNESNYAYGIKAGAPRVMRLLKDRGMRATFTAAAQALERAPDLTQEIVAQGHEVCSHGWRWVHQFGMDESAERAFIQKAVDSITRTTGERPYGWLSRYLLTPNTRRLLIEAGFTYHMDDYSDDLPFWNDPAAKDIVIMPYALDSNDMKMWTDPAMTPAQWLDYAVDSFDWLYAEGEAGDPKMMSFGVHLRIIGRPGRIGYFAKFLDYVATKPDVWIATRREIADCFRAQSN
jgi:allantoinase